MKRLSVTHLETFRRFRDGTSEWDTEQKVIDAITGTFVGNDYTFIGTAGHYVIETTANGLICSDTKELFGVTFSAEQVQMLKGHATELMPFVPEVKSTKQYHSPIGEVTISGIADVLKGCVIRDNKFKFSAPKLLEYYDSCQWRFYLSIFGLEWFYYDIFEFDGYKPEFGRDVSGLQLIPHEPFGCYAYLGMEEYLQTLIIDFVEWASFRGLLPYLKDQ